MNRFKLLTTACLSLGLVAASSLVAANELGGSKLTPLGAEKAGNAAGTIPAWEGGLAVKEAKGGYTNPFANEKPLFTITASNYKQYEKNLTQGHIELLKKYPASFKLPVYTSHRTASYPQKVYDQVKSNANTAKLVDKGNGVEDFVEVIPFPLPKTGIELVWNHSTRYRSEGAEREVTLATPQASGAFTPVTLVEEFKFIADPVENNLFYFLQKVTSPARLAGTVLLVQETMNQVKEGRRAWVYNAGQRRVRRAPQVAYDGPGTAADGQRTSDGLDLFNGSPDRYEWTLLGKQELYIPYNSYPLLSKDLKLNDLIKAGHLNQDHTRYELHRVWVVEGKVKEGSRHIYAKRVMYFDEDTYQLAGVDHYDGQGKLWRVAEGHKVHFYDAQVPWYAAETLYDLVNGRYLVSGLINETQGYNWNYEAKANRFTPNALERAGR